MYRNPTPNSSTAPSGTDVDKLEKHERHNTVAETRYWCNQYKILALSLERRAIAAEALAVKHREALQSAITELECLATELLVLRNAIKESRASHLVSSAHCSVHARFEPDCLDCSDALGNARGD